MRAANGREWAWRARLALLVLAVGARGLTADLWAQQASAARRKPPVVATAGTKVPAPTYTKDVAAILQAKCQNCHRRHQVGPFALETYEQARKRAHDIAAVTEERSMPPWKPTSGRGTQAQA